MPTEQETKIADLEKQLATEKRLSSLTDAQRAHHGSLKGEDASTYLAKSSAERDAVLAEIEKANEVVYTSKTDGSVYRKNDDPRLVTMAKAADKHTVDFAKAQAETERVTLEKRAEKDLSHFAKSVTVRAAIVKAIDGIADEAVRKDAHEALKGANAAMTSAGAPIGANPGEDAAPSMSPSGELKAHVTKFQKDNSIQTYEQALLKAVAEDPKARELYANARPSRV